MKHNLDTLLLLVAFGLFLSAVTSATPQQLAFTAETMLAQVVGATASVPENPVNTYMQALEEKEAELDEREKRIAYLEERKDARDPASDPWALASFGTSMVLFGAVSLNFYFDRKRGRTVLRDPFSINLKQRG